MGNNNSSPPRNRNRSKTNQQIQYPHLANPAPFIPEYNANFQNYNNYPRTRNFERNGNEIPIIYNGYPPQYLPNELRTKPPIINENVTPNEFQIVNLDNKYANSIPPLKIDLNSNGNGQFKNHVYPEQNNDLNKNHQILDQNADPQSFGNITYKKEYQQEINLNQVDYNKMNVNNMPPYQNYNNNIPQIPLENKNIYYQQNGNIPSNPLKDHNQAKNFRFNEIYDNQDKSSNKNANNFERKNANSMMNPEYYRQDSLNNNKQRPQQNFQVPDLKKKPNTDTSIEKQLMNNNNNKDTSMSKDESLFRDKRVLDQKPHTFDNITLKKDNDTKIKEKDLLEKNTDGINKDYNNVFLNENGRPTTKTQGEMREYILGPRRMKQIHFKNDGFEKLEEISNLFIKRKQMSISKQESIIEDFSHFFIFPGTSEYNQLNINPLFYILYNDDLKSKYCCSSCCRSVYAKVLHAKGIYKGHEFLEIYEDNSNSCSDQIFINYTEEGHKFKIGMIEINKTCCIENFSIINEKDQILYSISQSISNSCKMSYKLNCENCQNIDFEVYSHSGQFLSKLKKKRNTCFFLSEVNEFDEFSLEFPQNSSKIEKSLLLACLIYLQKKFFEG